MKKHIISIGRQYGCGAHEIATKLSEKLGIPYRLKGVEPPTKEQVLHAREILKVVK